jgi:hypothetical protein
LNDYKINISKNLELIDLYEYSTTEESKENTEKSVEFIKKVEKFMQKDQQDGKLISLEKLEEAIGLNFFF